MIFPAIASLTDAPTASYTDFASYTDYETDIYTGTDAYYGTDSYYGTETYYEDPATITYNAAFRASTPVPWDPPDGIKANFHARNVNGTIYIVVTVVGLVLATTLTLMRLYTKAFIKRAVGWDDYTCALSLMGLVVWSALTIQMARMFMGQHQWNIIATVGKQAFYYKLELIANAFYLFVLCSIKVSILLLYLHTFKVCGRKLRITLYSIMILIITSHIAALLVDWLSVSPMSCFWEFPTVDENVWEAHCTLRYDQFPYFVFLGAFTIVLDVVIIALPVREVLHMRMVTRQKIALVMVFLIGVTVTIASLLRLVYVVRRFYFDDYDDNQFTEFQVDLTSTIELDLALICANVPTLQTFVHHFMPGLLNLEPRKEFPNGADARKRSNGRRRRHRLISETLPNTGITLDVNESVRSRATTAVGNPNTAFFGNKPNGSFITSHLDVYKHQRGEPF